MAMTVTNTKGMKAPTARNWVSNVNQNRARDVQNLKERETTKYAYLRYSKTSAFKTNLSLNGNPNNSADAQYAPLNIFDKTDGVVATYATAYTPPYISAAQIRCAGTDIATTALDNEWIQWLGTLVPNSTVPPTQLVDIEGCITVALSSVTPRIVRLRIFVNDVDMGLQLATIEPIAVFGASDGYGSREVQVRAKTVVNPNDIITLMADRVDAEDTGIDVTLFTASLSVKTIPMG